MLDYIVAQTEKYISNNGKADRKKIGQFFTSKETALFMADLFEIPKQKCISVLDPGAGTGILTAALVEKMQDLKWIEKIKITCYENSESTVKVLQNNLESIKSMSRIPVEYEVKTENYITSQSDDFNGSFMANEKPAKYDLVIGNPPYMKIARDAREALAMPAVCHGAPNMYFLFTAMSLFNLRDGGEMVYIIPRSWTSGAYFKSFRKYLLTNGKLLNIHLFVSRDKVFEKESVLQETIIIRIKKQKNPAESILVSSSHSNSDFHNVTQIIAPYSAIVSKHEYYVFLVTSDEELMTLALLNNLDDTLFSVGCKMKTGLTVDFRCRDLLRSKPEENAVPLFYAQHIQSGSVIFPCDRDIQYIATERSGLIQKNKNYIFVKRFTAKEEKRRLQAGIYLSESLPEYKAISTQNKINFIDSQDGNGLSKLMAYGLYTLMNSSIYDLYYRMLNGSTQVNSTEINQMPVPSKSVIISMGRKLMYAGDLLVGTCDRILEDALCQN
jgi:adenine-specific DNA-methyltransferase